MNHPLLLILMSGVGIYCYRLWWADLQINKAQNRQKAVPLRAGERDHVQPAATRTQSGAMPGAEPSSARAVGIAVAGALIILIAETWGESALGLSAQQSHMTALFAAYSVVAAPVIEEIIFRGFLVVESPRKAAVWVGAFGASLIFTVLHPFLWRWDDAGFAWTFNAKGGFSTAVVFATSLWLYAARLAPWNPTRSLLPCFAGHAAKNLGVVAIKGALGFLSGWW
jgi:membrane protease YdiL (CAAX protease family)